MRRKDRRIWHLLLCALALAQVPCSQAHAQSTAPAAGQNPPVQGTQASPTAPPAPPPTFASVGPLSLSANLTADLVRIPAGGVTPGLKLLTKTVVVASYDGSSGPLPGWSAQASIQLVHGDHPSAENVGDVQGIDNVEAANALRLYEFWISRQWRDGAFGAKFGLTDLNVDFDVQQVAALFLNSSDGVGTEFSHSGLTGPSIYPVTALGLSGFWKPSDAWTLRAGLFDGIAGSPDHAAAFVVVRPPWRAGLLLVGQAEHQLRGGARAELGAWTYTAGFDALHRTDATGTPLHLKRDRGLYALIEGPLRVGERTSLAGWVRAGLADPVVQRVSAYVGLGLVASGLIPSRGNDQAGIALNHAIVDDPSLPPGLPPARRAETSVEATYKVQLRDWVSLQPDLQYVFRPGGNPRVPNAVVFALRLNLALTQDFVARSLPGS